MRKIGFIGVGIMGKSMVRNLMKAGFTVNIYARDMMKVVDVIGEGAIYHGSISDCVNDCDVVITIVGFPKDVEQVYYSRGGILESAKKGAYLIDMTTTSPTLAEKIFKDGTQRGFRVMDAPVTGGSVGARDGKLSILIGGEKADFNACLPIFRAMGTEINYMGRASSGQHAKLANQIMIAGALSGICEALTYARLKGINSQTLVKALAPGAAGSRQLDLLGPKILAEDYEPGFYLKHFIKDMGLAQDEAKRSYLELDVLSTVLEHCQKLEAEGFGDLGSQALIKYYEEAAAKVTAEQQADQNPSAGVSINSGTHAPTAPRAR